MPRETSDRVVLVTGASRGIGYAIAQAFAANGCKVAINGRDQAALARAAAAMNGVAWAVAGDVTRPEDAKSVVEKAVQHFGGLDVLVANVGGGRSVPPGSETAEEWQRVFALNLWSATNMVEAAKSALAARKGAIVCISSICGSEVVPGAPVTYSAAKAALNAYVRGIARPLGRDGIRINAVAPGNILFEGSVWQRKRAEDAAAVDAMLEREVALRTLGAPDDVAGLVVWLSSPQARFATGCVYVLDGGQVRGG